MDELRRRELLRMIGALGAAGVSGWMSDALAAGDVPPSLHRLDGTATVNGRSAKAGTQVSLGDRIETGPGSQAVVVLRGDAFLMRSQTIIVVQGEQGVLKELLVSSGKVLSVFAKKPVSIKAASATIGIRGTGAYLEVEPQSVYFCLCYGEALVEGPRMSAKVVKTTHHEQPLMLRDEGGILRAEPGPFLSHTDAELIMLEALVGREPPFMKDGQYPAKKY
jgi:FecR protein